MIARDAVQEMLRRRRLLGRPVETETLTLTSAAGYRIVARVHRPRGESPLPGLLLCPGSDDPGSIFHGWSQPVHAGEIAATGVLVMDFDPAGRGESWGAEDYGGDEHQDNVRICLEHLRNRPDVLSERIGVLAISLGLGMAAGALGRWGTELGVAWLLDWEGPSDREIMTGGGQRMAPALGHSLRDEAYWRIREPVHHVPNLVCGYVRIQAERDHAQPGEFRHALRMIQAAASGEPSWFRLNEHPENVVPSVPRWCSSGRFQANRILLRELARLFAR